MRATPEEVVAFRPGLYQHWKGPMYLALFLVQNSTNQWDEALLDYGDSTEEPMVVYVSLDAGPHQGHRCARELWQWNQLVDWSMSPEGKPSRAPRFKWAGP